MYLSVNHLLDARTITFSPKKSWEILLNSWDFEIPATFTREARVPIFGHYTTLLRGLHSVRTALIEEKLLELQQIDLIKRSRN